MLVCFGTRLYGKCDQLPGLGYVATRFFHIQYLPLIPLETQLILEGSEQGNGWRGIPMPLSLKSIGFAWLRSLILIGGFAATMFLLFYFMDHNFSGLITGGGLLAEVSLGIFLFGMTYRLSTPSAERTAGLLEAIGYRKDDSQGTPAEAPPGSGT